MPQEFYNIDTSKIDNTLNYNFKSKFRTVKPEFSNKNSDVFNIDTTEEDSKNVFEINKINFNHLVTYFSTKPYIFSLDNKISPLYIVGILESTKKIDIGRSNGEKSHMLCYVITPVKKSSKTSDIIKQTILNMNSKTPNLNNYDMNDFFPVNNTIYSSTLGINEDLTKPYSQKQKENIDKYYEKIPPQVNIISESDDLTINENDLQNFIKNNSFYSSKYSKVDTNLMKKINEDRIYKKESSSGWGFSINKTGSKSKDEKDDIIIDCAPVDLNKNGEEIEVDANIGKVPSPEQQFEKLMKNPFIMIIFGFFIIGIFVKGFQYLFKFAKDSDIVGKMKRGMGNIREKLKRNKHGKNFSDAVTNPVTKQVQRNDEPGARLSFSRSKDPRMKLSSDKIREEQKKPLLGPESN